MKHQQALGLSLIDEASFDNFFLPQGSPNTQVVEALIAFSDGTAIECSEPLVFLWGHGGAGVTHLLNAACHRAHSNGLSTQYLPLSELLDSDSRGLFEGLEKLDLVVLDDVHLVANRPQWEQSLFNLFNALRDNARRLLVGANCGPHELSLSLADIRSRLHSGLTFQVLSLSDEEMIPALVRRAGNRGLQLQPEVAQFILHRMPRNTSQLFGWLDQLDSASMEQQRKLTIPFIKQVLDL